MNPSKQPMSPKEDASLFVAALAGIGAVIAFGRALADDTPVTPRILLGRAILSAGTGVAAGSVLLFFPDAPALLLYGVGAAMASLGTSGIEMLLARRFGGPTMGPNSPQPGAGRARIGDPD